MKVLLKFKASGVYKKNLMHGMRTFSAEFLSTVHEAPYSWNELHAEILFFFFFFSNKFRAGMPDNEDTLACTTRQELMFLADITSYRAEYGRSGKYYLLYLYKFHQERKVPVGAKSNSPCDSLKQFIS